MDIKQVQLNDFVGIWDNALEKNFCDHIVNLFNSSSFVRDRSIVDIKDQQMTLTAYFPHESQHMCEAVEQCLDLYIKEYFYLRHFSYHNACILVQKTRPKGDGFHSFHAEDVTWSSKERHLAWTVYLNDVNEGGETEFLYQQLKIKPVTGRVAIWPGSFTHLHRGNPPTTDKYIATGWYTSSDMMKYYKPELF